VTEIDESNKETNLAFYRKEQTIEIAVFLFLIIPSMTLSLFAASQGPSSFVLTAVATIFRDMALVALIIFFVWRNRESLGMLGLVSRNVWTEFAIGVGLFLPMVYSAGLLIQALKAAGFTSPSAPLPALQATGSIFEIILGTILVAIVAFSEETIFRGYLLLRFNNIFSSKLMSVFLSAFIFSLGHGYEGTAGMGTVGYLGILFGLIYLWRGSLIAPMVMHFLLDFIGLILFPLLGGK